MIKSEINSTDKKEIEVPEYPCLKEYTDDDGTYIVLFVNPKLGTVLYSAHPDHEVGYTCSVWPELFTKTSKKITLENI